MENQTIQNQSVTASPNQPQKHFPFLSFFLSVLILLFLSSTTYLVYQNMQLQKQIAILQLKPSPTPTPSPIPTANSPTTVQMDWKSYTDSTVGFSLHYPSRFHILSASAGTSDQPSTLLTLEASKTFPNSPLTTRDVFQVQSIPNLKTGPTCAIKTEDSSPLPLHKVIDGETFYYSTPFGGGAAGTHDTNEEYKVFHGNVCYEIDLRHFESSDWNNPNDQIVAKSELATSFDELHEILSIFTFTSIQNPAITPERAAEIVSNLPQVKSFMSKTPSGHITLESGQPTDTFWTIHVYESLNDHLATFHWYEVDKTTGVVTQQV